MASGTNKKKIKFKKRQQILSTVFTHSATSFVVLSPQERQIQGIATGWLMSPAMRVSPLCLHEQPEQSRSFSKPRTEDTGKSCYPEKARKSTDWFLSHLNSAQLLLRQPTKSHPWWFCGQNLVTWRQWAHIAQQPKIPLTSLGWPEKFSLTPCSCTCIDLVLFKGLGIGSCSVHSAIVKTNLTIAWGLVKILC